MAVLTEDQAKAFAESGAWENMTLRQRAEFQATQPLLCMPFEVFHEAVEKTLGRLVFKHEFARIENILKELFGEKLPPTLDEVLAMIPPEKLITIKIPFLQEFCRGR